VASGVGGRTSNPTARYGGVLRWCPTHESFTHGLIVYTKASERSVMEAIDTELDRLISRRASQDRRQDPCELEPSYAESVRRYHSRRRKEIAAAWFAHFCRMAENHARISEDYERRAEELCKEG